MKSASLISFALILFSTFGANAQGILENSQLSALPTPASDTGSSPDLPRLFASTALVPASELPGGGVRLPNSFPLPQVAVPQRVFFNYSFQAYVGYTFVRANVLPGQDVNRSGFDLSLSYYPKAGHFGAEGALTTTFGSIKNQQANFLFAGGGPRYRRSAARGIEVWAHGLVGDAYFGTRLSGFGQSAFGYELGGGVDINAHLQHLAYRVEADMVSTRFYSNGQYSPKVSIGIAYKF